MNNCPYCPLDRPTAISDFNYTAECWACAEVRKMPAHNAVYTDIIIENGQLRHKVEFDPVCCPICGEVVNHGLILCENQYDADGLAAALFSVVEMAYIADGRHGEIGEDGPESSQ